jgi:hypothetical protein
MDCKGNLIIINPKSFYITNRPEKFIQDLKKIFVKFEK